MNFTPTTFWEHVNHLRQHGLIDPVWKTAHLSEYLEQPQGQYAPSTVSADPYNYSISREGGAIGYFVKKGESPKAWRVGRGQFQLIEDPDDDLETQRAQMRLATKRAEELRAKKRNTTIHSEVASTSQSSVARPKPGPISPVAIDTALTEVGRKKVDDLSTEQKALSIVREFLKDRYGDDVKIEEDLDGVDLRVTADGRTERIVVKGTAGSTMEWEKLKVSSPNSHDALVRGDALIYRVVDVHGADPIVYMLIHGEDFTLEPEPRWAVKQVPPDNERYPLRGLPYRYDRPHDPVALEDWEILK